MELFNTAHGLLFTMTTITPSFFAPERSIEHRAAANKTAWRSLLASGFLHVFGVIVVIILSQLSINSQKARVNDLERTPEISARLYYPPILRPPVQAKPQEMKSIDVSPERQEIELKTEATKATEALDSKNKIVESPTTKQQKNAEPDTQQVLVESKPTNTPPSPTFSKDANRRAGSLNLSAKDGAALYFEKYHSDKVAEDAEQAAKAFQERKNSPVLSGPSTQQIQANENRRPSKRVNCSSTTNKTLAILSGIAGGTLECTKMDDHKRFIEARVNKLPKDEEIN